MSEVRDSKGRELFPAYCTSCGCSRGLKRTDRLKALCLKCKIAHVNKTKLENSTKMKLALGYPEDFQRSRSPCGRLNIRYRISCPTCGVDKGYRLKRGLGTDCFQCSANKSGIKNKGLIPPNKGKSLPESSKIKMSCTKQGIKLEEFSGFVTIQRQVERTSPLMKELKKQCFVRDDYTCQICKTHGIRLNAHHLNSWLHHPEQRYLLANLVTLCEPHHKQYHKIFGKGTLKGKPPNTLEQFNLFKETYETISTT